MKGLMIFSNGMEDIEALATRDLLMRAGIEVVCASYHPSLEVKTSYGLLVKADMLLQDASEKDFDFLIIPGGPYVAATVDQDEQIKHIAMDFNNKQKSIGAICAGPRFLGQAGLLNHKNFTCFPGSEIDMKTGKYLPKKQVVKDGNIITARGAGVVYAFGYELIKTLINEQAAKEILARIQH